VGRALRLCGGVSFLPSRRNSSGKSANDGKRAEIKVENGSLVLRPIVKPGRKSRYTLYELLNGMTRDNVPQEDWGPQSGNEAW
jgi:antitoxin component of MazEF toxin-antitoxin module